MFYKGLANKRVSSAISIGWFEEAVTLLAEIFGTEKNHLVTQSLVELGTVYKREHRFDDAQDIYTAAGEFIAEYANKEVYGEFKGE